MLPDKDKERVIFPALKSDFKLKNQEGYSNFINKTKRVKSIMIANQSRKNMCIHKAHLL